MPRAGTGAPEPVFVELAAFTTGTSRDDTAPAVPTDAVVASCCSYDACESSACCGPSSSGTHSMEWTLDDGTVLVEYRVDGVEAGFGASTARSGYASSGMFGVGSTRPTIPEGSVQVRAIDAAGNTSAWSVAVELPGCEAGVRPDAGFSFRGWTGKCLDVPDGGMRADLDAGPSSELDAGPAIDAGRDARHVTACGCTAGRTAAPSWLVALPLLVVLRRRRGAVSARSRPSRRSRSRASRGRS